MGPTQTCHITERHFLLPSWWACIEKIWLFAGINPTVCPNNTAIWVYDYGVRRCRPAYCSPNPINNFETKEECESICPRVFPPRVTFPGARQHILIQRGTVRAEIVADIRANPLAKISWFYGDEEIEKDHHYQMSSDGRYLSFVIMYIV